MTGDAEMVDRDHMEADEDRIKTRMFPKAMFPAPPLATVPTETPALVSDELHLAFRLFWIDEGACANRIRISVEKILDHFSVVKGSLFERIEQFKAKDPEHAETFDALRLVGNVGSHEGVVRREAILDAFEIYQDALRELFGNHRAHIDAIRKKLIASKGK